MSDDDELKNNVAIVHFLDDVVKDRPTVIDATAFRYCGHRPQAVDVASIIKPVKLLATRTDSPRDSKILALPYGVTRDSIR
jgi:hypothetical protein